MPETETGFKLDRKLLVINSVSGIVAKVIHLTVLVWLQQYLLARISTDEYALYPVIMAIMVFVYMVRIVFTSGLSRFTTEAFARKDDEEITRISSSMFVVTVGIAALLLAAGGVAAWFGDHILNVSAAHALDARLMMGIAVVSIVVQVAASPFEVGLYARQRFVAINVIEVLTVALRIVLLFTLLFGVSTRVIWVSVATETATVCGVLARVVLSRRAIPAIRFRLSAVNRSTAGRVGSFGSWTLLGQVAYRIVTSADPIILNRLATPLDVTCFHLGNLLNTHLHSFIQTMAQPLVPAVTSLHAVGDHRRVAAAYLRYGRYYPWAFLMAAVPVVVFRRELVTLYVGADYLMAAIVILILLTESVLCLSNFMLYTLAVARGEMKSLAVRTVIMQVLNLGLTLYLVGVQHMGAVGSALSTFIIHQIGGAIFEIPLGLRLARVPFRQWVAESVAPGYIPALVTLGALEGARHVLQPTGVVGIGLVCAGGAVVYLAVLGGFCLREGDRGDLAAAIARVRTRFGHGSSANAGSGPK